MLSSFGDNLRELRVSRGYSQDRFARLIGSNQVNVSAWEVGRRTPSIKTIQHIADTFHIPLTSLISIADTGNESDTDRELVDLIRSNPKIRQLVDKARFLSNADINMLLDMIGALTRTRV